MTAPQRIRLSRQRGYRKPGGAVVVARPSKWGNPFAVGSDARVWHLPGGSRDRRDLYLDVFHVVTSAHAVRLFRTAMTADPSVWRPDRWTRPDLLPLEGKDLACWCPASQPCHADELLALANYPFTLSARSNGGAETD